MTKPITTIVTIPDMIAPKDWRVLSDKSEVQYIEVSQEHPLSERELLERIKDSDYLMIDPDAVGFKLEESFYREVSQQNYPLKAISADITGMSWASPEAAKKYGIPLMNTADYSTVSVSEYIVALLLLHVKGLNDLFENRVAGKLDEAKKNEVLYQKTLGIVGLGNIGKYLANLAKGFGMNVVAWNRTPLKLEGVTQTSLEDVFSKADYVSINLATNSETKGIIDKKYLDLLKPGTILINEADGPIVNNDDLVVAMQAGKIKVYAANSKAAKNHEALQKRKEFKPVPASAWFTDHSLGELRKIWVENIVTAINGKPQNLV